MNEWSSQGFHSGSPTTDPRAQTTVYRQYWEENWYPERADANPEAMNNYRIRDFPQAPPVGHQFVSEDVAVPPYCSSRKRRNGTSDPRFKRVINSEMRNGCSELESVKTARLSHALGDQIHQEKGLADEVATFLKSPNEPVSFKPPIFKKFGDLTETQHEDLVTRDSGFGGLSKFHHGCEYPRENFHNIPNLRDFDRVKVNSKTNLRRSASDCTLHTKNTLGEENEEEVLNRIRPYPSATRLSKVQDWIKEYKTFPEKRSVITVIGQTQTKPFSKILNEIKQRRKLAKELDKHALCEAIMESPDVQPEVKNLVAKVDFVLPDGKVIYSAEKVYVRKGNSRSKVDADCGDRRPTEALETNDQLRKRCEMIPERDSSVSQIGKKTRTRRSCRKLTEKERIHLTDKISSALGRIPSRLLWTLLVVVGLAFCTWACSHTVELPEDYGEKIHSTSQDFLILLTTRLGGFGEPKVNQGNQGIRERSKKPEELYNK